jgi:hypothetical protein
MNTTPIKPGDTIEPTGTADDWVAASTAILDAAPVNTVVRDRDGDQWQRMPNRGHYAWRVEGGPGVATTASQWLVTMYFPITVLTVPEGGDGG